jgi:hypothetical protein
MRAVKLLKDQFAESPLQARVVPFAIFLVLTFLQGQLGEAGRYWVYLGKTLAGIWLIWLMRPYVAEMRWAFSWEAVVAGVAVFAIWVGLDPYYPRLDELMVKLGLSKAKEAADLPLPWNPFAQFGEASALAWLFVIVRILGSTFVVPPLEETFYRSFLYRYIVKADFMAVTLGTYARTPFLITCVIFGVVHAEWLAGMLCGAAYLGLMIRKQRLGDAMTAHAITNFLLGAWVVWRGAWQFW